MSDRVCNLGLGNPTVPTSSLKSLTSWCLLLAGIFACQEPMRYSDESPHASMEHLWSVTVEPYLTSSLWTDDEAYDAGHYLMVPLYAAFRLRNANWQHAFADQFERFATQWLPGTTTSRNRLNRLQYYYLAAEFLTLAGPSRVGLVPDRLPLLLQSEVREMWDQAPSPQWGGATFTGMRERLLWKLSSPATHPSYYRAVLYEDLLVFATAADLKQYARVTGWKGLDEGLVDDILRCAITVFKQRVAWRGAGWLFQPGVWADHPDFAFAGRTSVSPGMLPAPLTDVAEDVSHSFRFPLWLQSLAAAWPQSSPERKYFDQLRSGLAVQFFEHVLRWPAPGNGIITTSNYMDGRDGVYRWNYLTTGSGRGYGPSELSGSLTLGWWSFLGVPKSAGLYRDLAARFPLDSVALTLYVGPNTTRIRNPLVRLPDAYTNGMMALLTRLAGELYLNAPVRPDRQREVAHQ